MYFKGTVHQDGDFQSDSPRRTVPFNVEKCLVFNYIAYCNDFSVKFSAETKAIKNG
jgi:hypothetical protein